MDIEEIGKQIVDSALHVHRALGPGLLESAYQACWLTSFAGVASRSSASFSFPSSTPAS